MGLQGRVSEASACCSSPCRISLSCNADMDVLQGGDRATAEQESQQHGGEVQSSCVRVLSRA